MTIVEQNLAIEIVTKLRMAPASSGFGNRYWLLIFKDPERDAYIGYDVKDPIEFLNTMKNREYKFVGIQGVDSQASAIEYAKALRTVARILPDLRQFERTFDSELSKRTAPTSQREPAQGQP